MNLTEEEDFILLPFKGEQTETKEEDLFDSPLKGSQTKRKGRGGANGNKYIYIYMLTPKTFKNTLLSSRNEKKYRVYYLVL